MCCKFYSYRDSLFSIYNLLSLWAGKFKKFFGELTEGGGGLIYFIERDYILLGVY